MFKKIVMVFILTLLPSMVLAAELIPRLDFEDASVINVISALAKQEKINLILSGDQTSVLSKKTTIHFRNIYPRQAIEQVLDSSGLDYAFSDNALFVSSVGGIEKARIITLKYLGAKKALDILQRIFPQLKTSAGEQSNSLILRGNLKDTKEAKEILESLDHKTPQILIESKIVEVSKSNALRLGLNHGNPSGTFNFVTSRDFKETKLISDITSVLNALLSEGKADIIANPKIATLDNKEAVINIGNRIPYAVPVSNSSGTTQWSVDYIDAGIKLKIIPHLGADEQITTTIRPEVSAISEWRTTPAGDFPVISTRNASATLRVKNGETIVVGGLISEAEREHLSRIPVLGHIPIAGLLFQNRTIQKEKTEILFLITPHIM